MKVIAVVGAAGGVGATTVAAHLTAAFAAQRRAAIAFDLCASNALRLHFGMAWEDDSGLAPQLLAGEPWHEAGYRSAGGVDFVPFGRPAHGQSPADFWARLREQPRWFAERLDELHDEQETLVVCDCPHGEESWRDQVLPSTQLALVVLGPDALSYAAAADAAHRVSQGGAREVAFLLNGFDATRPLDRDIAVVLRHDFERTLIPVVVHRDESVREAVASRKSVFEYAPSSRAAHDLAALAGWAAVRADRQARAA